LTIASTRVHQILIYRQRPLALLAQQVNGCAIAHPAGQCIGRPEHLLNLLSAGRLEIRLPPSADPLTFQFFCARAILSGVILACALYVILSKRFQPREKHWAYGVVGTLIGYWLKA
jgi:hypothetical protein